MKDIIIKYIKYFFRLVKEVFVFSRTNSIAVLRPNNEQNTKVMTFNIRRDDPNDNENNWVYRRDAVIKMIQDEAPDIICFQEVMPTAAKFLVSKLSRFYDNAGLAIFMDMDLASCNMVFDEGLLVMWRKDLYDFVDKNVEKLFDGRKINLRRFIDVTLKRKDTGERFNVINTHFCYLNDEVRRKSFEKLFNYAQDLKEVYICGDFNIDITRNNIVSDIITDKYSFNNRVDSNDTTINLFGKANSNQIIDYIFSNKRLHDFQILKNNYSIDYLSDHYPVIVNYQE